MLKPESTQLENQCKNNEPIVLLMMMITTHLCSAEIDTVFTLSC